MTKPKPCSRYCPFASCTACIWSGGSVPQQDSAREPLAFVSDSWENNTEAVNGPNRDASTSQPGPDPDSLDSRSHRKEPVSGYPED